MKYIVRTCEKTREGVYHYLSSEGLTPAECNATTYDTMEEARTARIEYLKATGRQISLEVDKA